MKRALIIVLLAGLGLAAAFPADAQIFRGPDSEKRAQKALKKLGL